MKKKNWLNWLLPVIILGINFLICFPWFKPGYATVSWSMEPVLFSQAYFIRDNWPKVNWNYNWYLGFPFKFTGSPLLPYLLAGANFLFPKLTIFFIYRFTSGLALISLPVSLYLLAGHLFSSSLTSRLEKEIQPQVKSTKLANPSLKFALISALVFSFLPSLLFLFPQVYQIGRQFGFFPWQFISLAILGNSNKIFGLALIPVCLLIIDQYLNGKIKLIFWPFFLVFLLSLVDLSAVVSLLILWSLLLISYVMVGHLGKKLKKSLRVLCFSFLALSFYYTPGFWWQALTAPSLAGKRAISVILLLGKLLSVLLPMMLALVSVRFLKKGMKISFIFPLLWVFVFLFLSLARFIADVDFWQDYTSWGVELGMGIALLVTAIISNSKFQSASPFRSEPLRVEDWRTKLKDIVLIFAILFSSLLWLENRKKVLSARQNLPNFLEYQLIEELKNQVNSDERVFLSGTPVFWLNSLTNLAQVRGGVDQAATHPFWSQASYQLRVGEDSQLAWEWLKALGTSWIMVHDQNSTEHYHDFIYPTKFNNEIYFQRIWQSKGDSLYRIKGVTIARLVNEVNQFLKLKSPIDGRDLAALSKYNSFLSDFLSIDWHNPEELVVKPVSQKEISLAITFDHQWQAFQGKEILMIKKDVLGQMVIFPKNKGEIILRYSRFSIDQLLGYCLSLSACFWLLKISLKTTSKK